jgi:hypothetical protein
MARISGAASPFHSAAALHKIRKRFMAEVGDEDLRIMGIAGLWRSAIGYLASIRARGSGPLQLLRENAIELR